MSFPVVYQPATKAASGPAPGAKVLMSWCLANYPPGTNLGIYNPRSVRGGSALSLHAEGRALDVGFPVQRPDGADTGWRLVDAMVDHHAALGVQCVIFARRIWSNTRPTWRPYAGAADHYDHVHIELTREAAAGLTTDIIRQTMGATTVPTPTTDRTAIVTEAQQVLIDAGFLTGRPDGDFGPKTLTALHAMKNHRADLLAQEANLIGQRDKLSKSLDDLAKANATSADTIKRLRGDLDEAADGLARLNSEADRLLADKQGLLAELATLRSAIVADVVADIRAAVAKLGGEA